MAENNIPPLLTAKQVAEILAMPVSTLKKNCSVCKESVPPFLKLGHMVNSPIRFKRSDVEVWIQTQVDENNSISDFQSLLNKVEEKI